jgi:thioredoxin 2
MSASHIVCPSCGSVNRVPDDRPATAAHCGSCHGDLFDGHPLAVDEAAFQLHVRANTIPVLVDVWAPWCGPCRMMAPAFERAAALLEPRARSLKLNADEAPNVCAQLGVRGIPALYLLRQGTIVARSSGAMSTEAIIDWARSHLASQST